MDMSQMQSSSSFGECEFSKEESEEIKRLLEKRLGKDQIAYRAGPGGRN
jgi:recombination DNA repair RAD52 pathway protein